MALTEEQWKRLREMTREHRPNIEISRWLTRECGVPFKEAAEARAQALQETGTDLFEHARLSQANLNVYHAKEVEAKKQATKDKRAATRAANKLANSSVANYGFLIDRQVPQTQHIIPKDACVTCGDQEFKCSCEIKRSEDIPF